MQTDSVEINESQIYFERGGPFYRLMQRIGVIKGEDPSVGRRVLYFWLITWLPIFILAVLQDRAIGPTPRESFLFDFASYARFFVAVPLLLLAEVIVGPRLTVAALQFVSGGFVRPEDYLEFQKAIALVAKRRESKLAEAVMVVIALFGAWTLTTQGWYGQ